MIVFLDFDGVVHGVSRPTFDATCIGHIDACLAECGAQVVIISSWKDEQPIGLLVERLQGLGKHVIGKCDEEPAFTRTPREHLVDSWLADHEYSGPWLALDDNPQWYGRHESRVLATEAQSGFTSHDIPRFRALVKALQTDGL